jgi:hypothetical protein
MDTDGVGDSLAGQTHGEDQEQEQEWGWEGTNVVPAFVRE